MCVDCGATFAMLGGAIHDNRADYGGGVYVAGPDPLYYTDRESGRFLMTGDAAIYGNTTSAYGGGVFVHGGVFKMGNNIPALDACEPVIRDNTVMSPRAYGGGVSYQSDWHLYGDYLSSDDDDDYNGGEYDDGDDDDESDTKRFIMMGGTISDNSAYIDAPDDVYVQDDDEGFFLRSDSDDPTPFLRGICNGGGVNVTKGNFMLVKGDIVNNRTTGAGGGVSLSQSGTMGMMSGSISGNEAYGLGQQPSSGGMSPKCGGGVYVGSGSRFALRSSDDDAADNDIAICDNSADLGGGVYVSENAGAFFLGGEPDISGNQAGTWTGTGLTRTLGDDRHDDNVYLCASNDDWLYLKSDDEDDEEEPAGLQKIIVLEDLAPGAPIGVTTELVPEEGQSLVFTASMTYFSEDGETRPSIASDAFVSDNKAYAVGINDDGEAYLGVARTVKLIADNGTEETQELAVPVGGKLTLPACSFTAPVSHAFDKWKIGETFYAAGGEITVDADTEVTATWRNISGTDSGAGNSDASPVSSAGPVHTVTVTGSATGAASHGSVRSSTSGAKAGEKVTLTLQPDAGYETAGVTVKDALGNEIPVTKNADGTYSYTMPDTAVTVTPEFTEVEPKLETPSVDVSERFGDVGEGAWYHDAIQWAVDTGLMNGVSGHQFAPDDTATRATVVTMLWRLAGQPEAGGTGFTDVEAGSWYDLAVAWAAETGAVTGTSETTFSPDAPITREQLATILYRYAQAKGKGFEGTWAFPLDYSDADEAADYAYEALCWMTMHGILTGTDDGRLAPGENATRAQIAVIFMRFVAEMEKE